MEPLSFARGPSTIRLGDVDVPRMGFGAMRLPGPDVWGEPADPARAKAVLRRAIELGVRVIDTAWFYGPYVANRLIRETLHPYPEDLLLVTKLGGSRTPDKGWAPAMRPEQLRKACEDDLQRLAVSHFHVTHLRYVPCEVPFAEALDVMLDLRTEGKILHVGLSNVSAKQLEFALTKTKVASVSNMFNIAGGGGELAKHTRSLVDEPERVLQVCTERGIPYLPYFPLAIGGLSRQRPAIVELAARHGKSVAQLGIAWLLHRAPVMLPIPGTGSVEHLEENCAATAISLTDEDQRVLAGE